jgi:hypothetical protein
MRKHYGEGIQIQFHILALGDRWRTGQQTWALIFLFAANGEG